MRTLVLNGPNLARLGRRQPEICCPTPYAQLTASLVEVHISDPSQRPEESGTRRW